MPTIMLHLQALHAAHPLCLPSIMLWLHGMLRVLLVVLMLKVTYLGGTMHTTKDTMPTHMEMMEEQSESRPPLPGVHKGHLHDTLYT